MIDADRLRSMFLAFFADGGHAILPSASLIAEVGDATHLACFEMLGNWSPGAYFERESITWSHDFLTRDDLLAIPPRRLWISVFAGNQATPADGESAGIWRALGSPPSDQNSTSATGALDAEPGTLPDQPGYDSSALSMRLRATWR